MPQNPNWTALGGLERLAVDHDDCGRRLESGYFPRLNNQDVIDGTQDAAATATPKLIQLYPLFGYNWISFSSSYLFLSVVGAVVQVRSGRHSGSGWGARRAQIRQIHVSLVAACVCRWRLFRPQTQWAPRQNRQMDHTDRQALRRHHRVRTPAASWVVERTFPWLGRCRRLAKDFEATVTSATAWLFLAHFRLLTREIAHH